MRRLLLFVLAAALVAGCAEPADTPTPAAPAPVEPTQEAPAPETPTDEGPAADEDDAQPDEEPDAGGQDAAPDDEPPVEDEPASDPPASAAVSIQGFAFTPSPAEVAAGATVTWTNGDGVPHSVVADDGSFSTPTMSSGASQSLVFTQPGTYAYHCGIHSSMKGTLQVA